MKSAEWYREEVAKMLAIVLQDDDKPMLAKNYLEEKLTRILDGTGIIIHPVLEDPVKRILLNVGGKGYRDLCPSCLGKNIARLITIPERKDDTVIALCKDCGYQIKNIDWHGKSIFG
jgi:hypothetical protein